MTRPELFEKMAHLLEQLTLCDVSDSEDRHYIDGLTDKAKNLLSELHKIEDAEDAEKKQEFTPPLTSPKLAARWLRYRILLAYCPAIPPEETLEAFLDAYSRGLPPPEAPPLSSSPNAVSTSETTPNPDRASSPNAAPLSDGATKGSHEH